jgi:hypothetical protein
MKLLTHPLYHSYQSHIATLSLFPRVYLFYVPPAWNAPAPPIPQDTAVAPKEKKDWKRRIKMYGELVSTFGLFPLSSFGRSCSSVGPAVEAFGFGRIIFGSALSPVSRAQSNASDWYKIGREAFAELGVDQESVDAVFGGNAQRIYSSMLGRMIVRERAFCRLFII